MPEYTRILDWLGPLPTLLSVAVLGAMILWSVLHGPVESEKFWALFLWTLTKLGYVVTGTNLEIGSA